MENPDAKYSLIFPTGNEIEIQEWLAVFARQDGALVMGVGVAEELVESITAELLGFAVSQNGLNFEPFKGREAIQKGVQAYLSSTRKA